MKKSTKRILIALGVIIILLIGGLGFAGNYFYTLAIDSTSDKSVVFGKSEADPEMEQHQKDVYAQYESNGGKDTWLVNEDGYRLHGYTLEAKTHQWIIAVHGYMGQGSDMLSTGNRFYDQGYSVLIPDLRSHGQSEGTAIGMGGWDSNDIVAWINQIIDQDKDAKIILYGVSMGASTVMMTTGHDLPSNVKAAIEDCGYTSAWEEFSYQLDVLFGLPSFPALDAANFMTMLRGGYNLKDADALKAVSKSKIPTLFIHGDADDFVPIDMVYPLYEAASCEKELLIIKDAGHAQSRDVDPDTYWSHVDAFIHQYIN